MHLQPANSCQLCQQTGRLTGAYPAELCCLLLCDSAVLLHVLQHYLLLLERLEAAQAHVSGLVA
jgi:hypothetical protein